MKRLIVFLVIVSLLTAAVLASNTEDTYVDDNGNQVTEITDEFGNVLTITEIQGEDSAVEEAFITEEASGDAQEEEEDFYGENQPESDPEQPVPGTENPKGLADHAGLIFTLLGLIAACCIAAIVLANRKGK